MITNINIDVMPYTGDGFQGSMQTVCVELDTIKLSYNDLEEIHNRQKLIISVFRKLILSPSYDKILKSLNVSQLKLSTMYREAGDWFINFDSELDDEDHRYLVVQPEGKTPIISTYSESVDEVFDKVDSFITSIELRKIQKITWGVFQRHVTSLKELMVKNYSFSKEVFSNHSNLENYVESSQRIELSPIDYRVLFEDFRNYFGGITITAINFIIYLNSYTSNYQNKTYHIINEKIKASAVGFQLPGTLHPLIIDYIDPDEYKDEIEIDIA